jgi:hypothetical protein
LCRYPLSPVLRFISREKVLWDRPKRLCNLVHKLPKSLNELPHEASFAAAFRDPKRYPPPY